MIAYKLLIRTFHRFKAYQPIYNLSPGSHQKKQKTPTLGGVVLLISLWVGWALLLKGSALALWLVGLYTSFAIIGLIDDGLSLTKDKNKGLSAKHKFILQLSTSFIFLIGYSQWFEPLTWWQMSAYIFVIVGTSNATNLTDGLDGLLSGSSLVTLLALIQLLVITNHMQLVPVCMVLAVNIAVFLWFNWHPAKVFMGDTGSLAIGAILAGIAIAYQDIWILIPLGAVYILETLSVIIQVGYYKMTKKRVFLMAPLHHHFELMGLSEVTVVLLFYSIGMMFATLI